MPVRDVIYLAFHTQPTSRSVCTALDVPEPVVDSPP